MNEPDPEKRAAEIAKTQADTQKLKSERAKNYVAAIAVFIGSIWALIQFQALLEQQIAQADLALKQAQLEEFQRDALRAASAEATLQINLQTQTVREADRYAILGDVLIENIGGLQTDVFLDPDVSGVTLQRLEQFAGEVLVTQTQVFLPRDAAGPLTQISVLPKRKLSLPFVFWVEDPGVYALVFEANVEPAVSVTDAEERVDLGLSKRVLWQERSMVYIPNQNAGTD